jgi:hypothetical protein
VCCVDETPTQLLQTNVVHATLARPSHAAASAANIAASSPSSFGSSSLASASALWMRTQPLSWCQSTYFFGAVAPAIVELR